MPTPLLTALANVPDSRKSQGRRHPLSAVLALAIVAVLSGAHSLTAISEWGREQSAELLHQLGFTYWPGRCITTLHRIFRDLAMTMLETVLTDWWRSRLPAGGSLAIEGKTLRGSQTETQTAVQLLVAFGQRLNVALAQHAISHHPERDRGGGCVAQPPRSGGLDRHGRRQVHPEGLGRADRDGRRRIRLDCQRQLAHPAGRHCDVVQRAGRGRRHGHPPKPAVVPVTAIASNGAAWSPAVPCATTVAGRAWSRSSASSAPSWTSSPARLSRTE